MRLISRYRPSDGRTFTAMQVTNSLLSVLSVMVCLAELSQAWTASWDVQRGQFSGNILDLDMASPQQILAVGDNKLLLRSRNAGKNWSQLLTPGISATTDFHAVDFADPEHGLVAFSTGLLRTDDGGESWTATTFPTTTYFGSIAYPTREAAYVSGSTGKPGIWKSTDGGVSWIPLTVPTQSAKGAITGLHFIHRDTGFALRLPSIPKADYYVTMTRNGGESWQDARIGMPEATLYHDSILAMRFADARTGYSLGFRIGPTSSQRFCLKTRDGGITWDSIPAPPSSYWMDMRFTHPDTGWSLGKDGLAETVDGGQTWTVRKFNNVRNMNTFRMGGLSPEGHRLGFAGGTHSQILRTGESKDWLECFSVANPYEFHSVHFPSVDTGFAVGIAGQVVKTSNGGNQWESIPTPGGYENFSGVYFITSRLGFLVGTDSLHLLRTEDGGVTWTQPILSNSQPLRALWFATPEIGIAVGNGGSIFRSMDGGKTWNPRISGTSQALRAVHFSDENTGYAVGDSGALLKTLDAGMNWMTMEAGTKDLLTAVHFLNATTGFVAGGKASLLKTVDGGRTWSPRTASGQGQGSFYAVTFSDAQIGLAMGQDLHWETQDAGESWSPILLPYFGALRSAAFSGGKVYVVGNSSLILASPVRGNNLSARPVLKARRALLRSCSATGIWVDASRMPRDFVGRKSFRAKAK